MIQDKTDRPIGNIGKIVETNTINVITQQRDNARTAVLALVLLCTAQAVAIVVLAAFLVTRQ